MDKKEIEMITLNLNKIREEAPMNRKIDICCAVIETILERQYANIERISEQSKKFWNEMSPGKKSKILSKLGRPRNNDRRY